MPINKFSTPEEVIAHYDEWDPKTALRGHIFRFYSTEILNDDLSQTSLERAIRILSTKAMETL